MKEQNYIAAAQSIGCKTHTIILRHLLPNILSQVLVVWTFSIASAILIETGLSFLGIGVPATVATWGSIMFEARENYTAWWLVITSGAAIFMLLFALYFIGDNLKTFQKIKADR
jgi:peptide/nickel transport system permease protein